MEPTSDSTGFQKVPAIENPTMPVADIPWSPPPIDPLPELGDTERATLIDRLRENAKRNEVDSTSWACLWLSDIESLREIVRGAGNSRRHAVAMMTMTCPFTMIRACELLPPFMFLF
jgi:hypothetical protein